MNADTTAESTTTAKDTAGAKNVTDKTLRDCVRNSVTKALIEEIERFGAVSMNRVHRVVGDTLDEFERNLDGTATG